MKLGLIADIHANYSALLAVTAALQQRGCCRVLCAGDVVGGGPRPAQCLAWVRQQQFVVVQGNHEEWVLRPRIIAGMNTDARADLVRTEQVFDDADRQYLQKMPLSRIYAMVHLMHASAVPGRYWPYVRSVKMLRLHLQYQAREISVVGHTHVAALGLQQPDSDAGAAFVEPVAKQILRGRVMINPGSVGQPRDGNWQASCAVLDIATREVEFLRLDYDLQAELAAVAAAKLPAAYARRLQQGR